METGQEVLVEMSQLTTCFQAAKAITTAAGGVPSGKKDPAIPTHALYPLGGLSVPNLCMSATRCPRNKGLPVQKGRVGLEGVGEMGHGERGMGTG